VTRATGAWFPPDVPDGDGPVAEFRTQELLAVRRFMLTALKDLGVQLNKIALDPSVDRKQLAVTKGGAELIAAWIAGNLLSIDRMLETVKDPGEYR
jgi:histidinol phosphatase-like enzyme